MYTSNEVLSIVGSIGILITALGAVLVNVIVALRAGRKLDGIFDKSTDISNQVQEVHTLTNSNLSLVKSELDKTTAQLAEMRLLVSDLKSERDKLTTIKLIETENVTLEQND